MSGLVRRPPAVVVAGLAGVFGSLDTALNVAFPDLVADVDLEVADLQWVVVCYVLAFGGLLLGAGQLGDRVGHERVLAFGAAVSTAGIVGCALAPNYPALLVARVVQGVGIAMVMASVPAMITAEAGDRKGRAIGVFQTFAAVGLAAGPIIGGALVQFGGWRMVFWFRVPLGVALLVLAFPVAQSRSRVAAQEDRWGAMLGTITIGAAVLALNLARSQGLAHPFVLVAVALTFLGGVGFVQSSRRSANPLLHPALLRSPRFMFANVLAVVANGASFATWLLVPALLIDEIGTSLVVSGFVLAASPALTAVVSRSAGGLADHFGARLPVVVGLGALAFGMGALSLVESRWSPVVIALLMAVVGCGLGLFTTPNMAMVMGALPKSKQGVGGGLSLMTRTIGIVAGAAAASTAFDTLEPERGFDGAFSVVFGVSAITLAVAAVVAVFVTPAGDKT